MAVATRPGLAGSTSNFPTRLNANTWTCPHERRPHIGLRRSHRNHLPRSWALLTEAVLMARRLFALWRCGMPIDGVGHGFCLGVEKPILFSERYGYRRVYRLGRIALELV